MALPLLAFFGLGLGGNYALKKYGENQQAIADQKARALIGMPPQELAGPTRGGQPLMSPGSGLMGGQLPPAIVAQRMMELGGSYEKLGQQTLEDLMGYKPPVPAQFIQSGTGNPGETITQKYDPMTGQAINIPGAQPRVSRPPGSTNVTINPGVEGADLADIKAFTNDKGENPAHLLGLPKAQMAARAMEEGYSMRSTAGEKTASQLDRAMGIVDQYEQMWFAPPEIDEQGNPIPGTGGIFNDYGTPEGWDEWIPDSLEPYADKLAQAVKGNLKPFDPKDPRYQSIKDFQAATLSPLAKSMGEVGALAEGDVERAAGFQIKMGGLNPDTPLSAQQKLNNIRGILAKGQKFIDSKKPGDKWTRHLKDGTIYEYQMFNEKDEDGDYIIKRRKVK